MGRRVVASTLVFAGSLAGLAILFLALAGTPPPARALPAASCTTVVSDIVSSTTWTDSCYRIVTSTVTIRTGVILTIAPITSTRVEFDPANQLIVDGSLQALGALDRPITFTSSSTAARCAWQTIGVPLSNQGLRLQYATVEYACAGLRIFDADFVQVYSSTFRYVGDGGPLDGAITGDTDNSSIVNNTIYSATNGIVLNESFGNVIRGNTIYNVNGYGLGLVKQTTSGGGGNQIADNIIWNTAHGLRLENGISNIVQANSLYQNSADALYLSEQASAQVNYNHVFSNGGSSAYRAGIFISGTGTSPSLLHNVVLDTNADAVMLDSTTFNPVFSALASYNALCSIPSYELRNNSAAVVVNAANNWWGSNAPSFGVNFFGPIALSDPMLLSITLPANQLLGGSTAIVTVTLRDSLNNTVPAPNHAVDVNARRVALNSSIGSFSPGAITVNDQGVATSTLTASSAGGAGYVAATGFCNYPVTATLQVTSTNTDLVVLKDDNIVPIATVDKPAARALIKQAALKILRPQSPNLNPGDVITYTIAVVNVSSYTATNVVLTETLPLYTDYVGGGWTNVSARTYITNLSTLAPGDGRILYFGVRLQNPIPTTVSFIYNTVCGFAAQNELTPADNCHTTDTPLFVGSRGYHVYLPMILTWQAPAAQPQVSFTKLTYVVVEGTPQATIDVKLNQTATVPITVSYFTANGTATAGQDYTSTSGSLVFTPGQTTNAFKVGIISDTLTEYWETVNLELFNPRNAKIGYPGMATLNIEDARTCTVPSSTLISLYSPMDMAYDRSTDRLFITNRDGPLGGSLSVGVISPTPQITRTVTGLLSAQGVAQDAARHRLYVAGWNWLTVIDSDTSVPTTTVTLGAGVNAHAVAYNPNNSKIYVTGFGDNSITIIDASTLSIIARLTNSNDHPLLEPSYIAVEPNSGKVYVTNHAHGRPSGWVTVIDGFTNQIVKSIYPDPGGELYGITADAVHGHIYLAAVNAANIYVIDAATDTQLGSFQVRRWSDNQPVPLRMIAVNPNPGLGTKIRLWLTSSSTEHAGLDNIISLTGNWPNLESPALGASLPPSPERGLRFDPVSKYLFVASASANRVTILRDTPETQQCLWPFVLPNGLARAAGAAELYVVVNQATR